MNNEFQNSAGSFTDAEPARSFGETQYTASGSAQYTDSALNSDSSRYAGTASNSGSVPDSAAPSAPSSLEGLKNLLWSVGIIVCCAALVVGLVFAVFQRNFTQKQDYVLDFNEGLDSSGSAAELNDSSNPSSDSKGNARGVLNTLERTAQADLSYITNMTFLVDSSFINLREMSIVDPSTVWATSSGSMPMDECHTAQIKFPNDGSLITAASAAMVSQPSVLLIGIGMDGLAKVDEDTFVSNYETLINDIKASSPDTVIICSGLTSVIPGYAGGDGLDVSTVSDGNDWVQLVCRDTGSYYLNIGEDVCESVQLLTRYAAANGKTLNRSGLEEFLLYVRTHAIP